MREPWMDRQLKDEEDEEWLQTRPVCEECGFHIQDEGAYCINDKWYHKDCLDKFWRWL